MKKLSILFGLTSPLALLGPSVFSQDTIYLSNKEKIISLVTEISDSEIRFKEFTNPNGPDFIVKKIAIDHIVFKNGEQKQFKKVKQTIPYGRNIISYHLFDIVYQDFAISYEHILKNGMVSFKVPLSLGFNNDGGNDGPYQYKNLAYTGFGVNVYVTGQQMASYFMGPELQIGIGKDENYYYDGYYNE